MYRPTKPPAAETLAFRRRLRRRRPPPVHLHRRGAARYVGVTWQAVEKARKAGKLRTVHLPRTLWSDCIAIPREDLDAWIKRREPHPAASGRRVPPAKS